MCPFAAVKIIDIGLLVNSLEFDRSCRRARLDVEGDCPHCHGTTWLSFLGRLAALDGGGGVVRLRPLLRLVGVECISFIIERIASMIIRAWT